MQQRARHRRTQLLAYDLAPAHNWSLPPVAPTPTPLPTLITMTTRAPFPSSSTKSLPHKIHLIRLVGS
ncbi:MAG TPA: hypothetical protein VKV40_09545 [Ktedonobacteraceae bacterium]|nr:hypothetical protein [Ktedonobacteraceae bacterium]